MNTNTKLYLEITKYIGQRENPSPIISNPWIAKVIDEMSKILNYSSKDDSKIAWCAIFLNWVLQKLGMKGSSNAAARTFYNERDKIGEVLRDYKKDSRENLLQLIKEELIQSGDICVFWSGSLTRDWRGHVAVFTSYAEESASDALYVLGGNQKNQINANPYAISRLLCVIRPEYESICVNCDASKMYIHGII